MTPQEIVMRAAVTLVVDLAQTRERPFEHYYAVVGLAGHAARYSTERWPGVCWRREMEGWSIVIGEAQPMRKLLRGGTASWQVGALHALRAERNVVPVLIAKADSLGSARVHLRPRFVLAGDAP